LSNWKKRINAEGHRRMIFRSLRVMMEEFTFEAMSAMSAN
jgi:hypothetical protein